MNKVCKKMTPSEFVDKLNEEELVVFKRLISSKLKKIKTENDAKGKLIRDSNTFSPGDHFHKQGKKTTCWNI